jgi:hypothetical protein
MPFNTDNSQAAGWPYRCALKDVRSAWLSVIGGPRPSSTSHNRFVLDAVLRSQKGVGGHCHMVGPSVFFW